MAETIKKPAPPKRPQCAFFIYKSDVYEEVKKANPGKKMTDITKIVSIQYKNLTKEQLESFESRYKINKAQFEKDKKLYEDVHGKIKNERKKKKVDKDKKKEPTKKQTKVKKDESDDEASIQNAAKDEDESDDDDEKQQDDQ